MTEKNAYINYYYDDNEESELNETWGPRHECNNSIYSNRT
jgi:hypothetical protein